MKPRINLLPRLGLTAVSVLVALLALEVAFRAKAVLDQMRLDRALATLGSGQRVPVGARVGLREIIRVSRNPRLIYELAPNLSVQFQGQALNTDEQGFRRTPPPPPGRQAPRIVGLGDSFAFGWGVADEACYLSRLASRGAHVINAAVPGYNTVMEVETLKTRILGAGITPDLVILHFVINDLDLPNFIRRRDSVLSPRRSFLLEYLAPLGRRRKGLERLEDVPFNPLEHRFEHEPGDVPGEYRGLIGLDAFRGAMGELKAMSDRHGFRVLVLCDFTAPDYAREACAQFGFALVETQERILSYMRDHLKNDHMTLDEYFHSPLVLSPRDTHPSAEGHALAAELLIERLRKDGLL